VTKDEFLKLMEKHGSGYIEAQLTMVLPEQGGRSKPVFTDYFPNWDIGNKYADGKVDHSDAKIYIENEESISPGKSGLIRIYPFVPKVWTRVTVGMELVMQEGPHIIGHAKVLGIKLKNA